MRSLIVRDARACLASSVIIIASYFIAGACSNEHIRAYEDQTVMYLKFHGALLASGIASYLSGYYQLTRPWVLTAASLYSVVFQAPKTIETSSSDVSKTILWWCWPLVDSLTYMIHDAPFSWLRPLSVGLFCLGQARPWATETAWGAALLWAAAAALCLYLPVKVPATVAVAERKRKRPVYHRVVESQTVPVRKLGGVLVDDFTPDVQAALQRAIYKSMVTANVGVTSPDCVRLTLARGCVWLIPQLVTAGSEGAGAAAAASTLASIDLVSLLPDHLRAKVHARGAEVEAAGPVRGSVVCLSPVAPAAPSVRVLLRVSLASAVSPSELRVVATADGQGEEILPLSLTTGPVTSRRSRDEDTVLDVTAVFPGLGSRAGSLHVWAGTEARDGSGIRCLFSEQAARVAVLPRHVVSEVDDEGVASDLAMLLSTSTPLPAGSPLAAAAEDLAAWARDVGKRNLEAFVESKLLGRSRPVLHAASFPSVLLHADGPHALWSWPFMRFADRELEDKFVKAYCASWMNVELFIFCLNLSLIVPSIYFFKVKSSIFSEIQTIGLTVFAMVGSLLLKRHYTTTMPGVRQRIHVHIRIYACPSFECVTTSNFCCRSCPSIPFPVPKR